MASADGQQEQLIDVQTEIAGLTATVTDLIDSVANLKVQMTGLMATRDGSIYGEASADDSGPAVRAKYFEEQARVSDAHDVRLVEF